MLSFALTVALAAPCGIPHKHKHHAPEPVQTCATPAVPMCFKQPDPDIAPIDAPSVYPYYINTPVIDDESGEGVWIETTYTLGSIGSMETFTSSSGGSIPPTGPGSTPAARAPEISGAGAAGALTLLLGGLACLRNLLKPGV